MSQYFYPENFRINDLVDELASLGNEVTVLTGLPNYPQGKFYNGYNYFSAGQEVKNSKIKLVRVPIIPRFSSRTFQLFINYLSFIFSASFMLIFYCRDKYDVVFTYAPSPPTSAIPSILISRVRKIPHIMWVQDLWPEVFRAVEKTKSTFFLKIVGLMMRMIYGLTDLILIPSKDFESPIANLGIKKEKIHYFPNWAEKFFFPISAEEALNKGINIPAQDSFKIMFAGNIGEAQSFDVIIEAAKKLKDENISWLILGDGRKKPWVDEMIKIHSLERTVFTMGQKPVQDMPYYFALADILLVSLRSHPVLDAWIPGKIQSYLACGKPIIGLISGAGAKVINESGAGFTVKSGDQDELIKRVLQMRDLSEVRRQKIAESALDYYRIEFERDKLIGELVGIFEDLS